MNDEQRSRLIEAAQSAVTGAYAPYSRFRVGAALLAVSGEIYTGCNIENASFAATICAERVAIYKAVSEGVTQFEAIAIASDSHEPCPPCGICRQVMVEFSPDMKVLMIGNNAVIERSASDLLPSTFQSHYFAASEDV
mgnify:CR=1 FL=1